MTRRAGAWAVLRRGRAGHRPRRARIRCTRSIEAARRPVLACRSRRRASGFRGPRPVAGPCGRTRAATTGTARRRTRGI